MRNTGISARKPRTDGLVIGTHQADIARRESSACHGIARRHALPRRGGYQTFTQDSLWAYARAGPIAPRGEFRSIRARTVPEAVAEQFPG